MAGGLAYCEDRDLEIYERYVQTHQARAALERGRWSEARDVATIVLHDAGPSVLPLLSALLTVGLVRARQGEAGVEDLLARAGALVEREQRLSTLAPVAAARAEAAWLEGRPEAIGEETEAVFALAVRRGAWREAGELARWRRRAGLRDHVAGALGPDAATLAGDAEEAARLWTELGCPYEAALALTDAEDDDAVTRGLIELQRLGARAGGGHRRAAAARARRAPPAARPLQRGT